MAFHVQIRRSFRRASAFNLDEPKLVATIVGPWRRGQTVELGDQEWIPAESRLAILEGRHLDPPDLAFGQGWSNAERASTDVSERFLAPAAQVRSVAVIAETEAAGGAVRERLDRLGAEAVEWESIRAQITPEGSENLAAVIAVESSEPSSGFMFDAGLALGALGERAFVVRLGEEPMPTALAEFGVIQLDQLEL